MKIRYLAFIAAIQLGQSAFAHSARITVFSPEFEQTIADFAHPQNLARNYGKYALFGIAGYLPAYYYTHRHFSNAAEHSPITSTVSFLALIGSCSLIGKELLKNDYGYLCGLVPVVALEGYKLFKCWNKKSKK